MAVPPGNSPALVDSLSRLVDDRAGCAAMGRKARTLAEGRFARPTLVAECTKFIEVFVSAVPELTIFS